MKKSKIFRTLAIVGTCLCAPMLFNGCKKDEDKFYITFMVNGQAYKTYETTENQNITNIPNPTKEGYSFDGWYLDENFENEIEDLAEYLQSNSKENSTLYAKFSICQFTISFNANGGSYVAPITQDYHSNITEPATPTKSGYGFEGWYLDFEYTQEFTFNKMPAEDITLYPKYVAYFTWDKTIDSGRTVGVITGLTEYGRNSLTKLVIPTSIDNISIKEIGDNAFANCNNITSITIDNCFKISDYAFYNCNYLREIIYGCYGNFYSPINETAFESCDILNSLIIDVADFSNFLCDVTLNILEQVENIYITSGEEVVDSDDDYFSNNFTKQAASDKTGYDMYVRNV
ncbi:MAG: InlB B-repeat-containing protein [Clostridia bacterium]|nr:InlB B-repeat-containing protein [Clostridia bacterium]